MTKKLEDQMNGFLRCRSYLRYSSTMQDDGFSIEYQVSEIQEYANRHGYELGKAHIDKAQTATKTAGRESFHKLVRDVKEGLVDVIIVFKMNRMFRNSEESEYYRRIFRKNSVKLISVTEHIDDQTSSGRLTTSILSNIDQYQSDVISDHVRAGLREMAKQCLFTGRPLLIGYSLAEEKHGKKKRKRFVINEEEAPFIRSLFEMYASGMSCREICRILKKKNIKTKKDAFFSENTIRRMLANDFYIGTYRYKVVGYDEIVVEDGVPAIVSKELFQAVQDRKKANDPKLKPRYRKRLYALTGQMICGKCGSHYIGTCSQHRTKEGLTHYNYYTCSNRKEFRMCDGLNVRKEWLEEEVMQKIRKHILNDSRIAELSVEIASMCENTPSELNSQIAELKANHTKTEKKYNKFLDAFFDDQETDNFLAKRTMQQLQDELVDIKKQLSVLTEQLRFTITPESIKTYLDSMLKLSQDNSIEVWKMIYENFIDKIIVTDDNIDVQLKVYPGQNLVDKESLAFPIVPLSATVERLEKYRPKNLKKGIN